MSLTNEEIEEVLIDLRAHQIINERLVMILYSIKKIEGLDLQGILDSVAKEIEKYDNPQLPERKERVRLRVVERMEELSEELDRYPASDGRK